MSADGPLEVHIDSPSLVHAGDGVAVFITCSADSRPISQFQWFVNVTPVVMETGPNLTILAIQPKVLTYTCKAYNNVTKISMSQSKTLTISEYQAAIYMCSLWFNCHFDLVRGYRQKHQ